MSKVLSVEEKKEPRVLEIPFYSIVIPVFNEADSIEFLLLEILESMKSFESFEIIFVNDGSVDQTLKVLNQLQYKFSSVIQVVHLQERRGQTHALQKGLAVARGEVVVTLDGDLQNDPADIAKILSKMKEGFDCVCGWRQNRQDTFLKTELSKLGNSLQRFLTGKNIHDISCTLRGYRKDCILKIPLNWEGQHRFIPLCLSWQGFRVGEIVSHHRPRRFGQTKYSHKRIFKVMADFFRILMARGRR